MSVKISSPCSYCTFERSVLVSEKVSVSVLTHSKTVAERCPTCSLSLLFPKGAEGQGEEGELPEGAGLRRGPHERHPLCPLPAALPAAGGPQATVPGLPPLRLPKLQPRPPRGGGLALPPLPLGQVSGAWRSRTLMVLRGGLSLLGAGGVAI